MSFVCPRCRQVYRLYIRLHKHLLANPSCAKAHQEAKAEEEAAKERRKQAREAERQRAEEAAAAAAAAAEAAREHDTNVSLDSNESPPIEDESFPFADDDCDGDEDNKETEGNEDEDDDEEEDEDEAEDADDASDESDDSSADESDDDPVRVGVRVSFPFDVPIDVTDPSKTEERYFHGTITSKTGADKWQVTFDDTEIFEYSYQETLVAVAVYQELLGQGDIEDSDNEGGEAAHVATHGEGEDAQEEEATTDGILHDVCKLIDGVREDSDVCGNPKGCMTPQNQAAAQLIALLQDSNAPLSLYSSITSWVQDNADNGTFSSGGKLPTRDKILKNLAQRYHMKGLQPKEIELTLPNAGSKIKVNTFSFTETLTSLLTDPELMKDENFAFPDPNDPFSAPEKWTDDKNSPEYQQQKDRQVGDLVGGRWYARTYHARCDASKKEILCPIIIFVDKTHSDVKGRLTQEPVMYTLGIFNQKTRNNPRAWRPLGLLPNFKSVRQDRNTERKQEDFHYVLSHVLQELKDVQKKEGVRVKFPYRGKQITAVFKVPTACVLGDHEGQNKNCGHKGCNTHKFCRRCDIKKEMSDEPMVGEPVLAKDIDKLREQNKKEELQARSHYMMQKGTAYTGMDFGCDDGGGINQYSFADVMHTIKHGLMDHIRLLLFDEVMPGHNEKDLKKHAKRLKSNDQEYGGRTKAGEKNEKVIAKKMKVFLDEVAKYWGRLLLHQSDRSLGKTHFPSGIASGLNSKFTCEEMPSVLLLLTMILASDIGRQFFETAPSQAVRKAKLDDGGMQMRMDSIRTADYIWAFEECIMMCELFASDLMTVEFVETYLRPYIGLLIERWTRKLPRNKGDGWRMVKFHNLMHFPDILLEMGNSKVSDTETGEHGHIRVKSLAQKTQRVLRTFDRQVAVRLYEDWAIIRARSELSGLRTPKKQPGTEQATAPVSSPKFVFDSRGEMSAYKNTPKTNCTEFHDTKLQGQVSGFLRTAVCEPMNMSEGETLTYYTEARVNDQLYRADPVFYTLRGENRGWHDVAMATHPHHKQKKVPVQLLGFLRFDNLQKPFDIPRQFKKFNSRVDNKTRLAIVHAFESAPKEPFHPTDSSKDEKEKAIQEKLHRQSRLLSVGKKILKQDGGQQDGLFLIRVEEIKEPCLAVPDVTAIAVQKGRAVNYTFTPAKRYIFVKSRSKWAEIYKTWITREVKDELAQKKKK